ncbi:MAG: hypothetical protein LBG30_01660 [Odoribacteraceae bacterium]|jgi:hypothetical protein|nr:hypothetical protein [Odoribacteraceae bacterium]
MENLLFFEIRPGGFLIVNLIKFYAIPVLLFFLFVWASLSRNKWVELLGLIGMVATSIACGVIGYDVLVETGLIVSGLAGFVFGVTGFIILFEALKEEKLENTNPPPALTSDSEASYQRGLHYMRAGRDAVAIVHMREAAEKGHERAMSCLVKLCQPEKRQEVARLLRPMAEQKNPAAQYHLAKLLYTMRENEEADQWLAQSVAQGYPPAVKLDEMNYMRHDDNET